MILTYRDVILKRMVEICKQRHIILNKLATLSGLRQSTIENLVQGKTKCPTLKTLHRIAVGLNMTVSEFLDFEEMNETVFDDE